MANRPPWRWLWLLLVPCVLPSLCLGQQQRSDTSLQALDGEVQALRLEVLDIHRELLFLEEELLYPERARLLVYVSSSESLDQRLESVQLQLDGRPVAEHRYDELEARSLRDGGVHRVYIGILPRGEHALVAEFSTRDTADRALTSRATVDFLKRRGPKYIELRLEPSGAGRPLPVTINQW